jgi:hypothetical protein
VTVSAPGWSAVVSDGDVAHWAKIGDGRDRDAALTFLVEAAWTDGEAREQNIAVSDADVQAAVDEDFPSRAAYREYLRHTGQTEQDMRKEQRMELLTAALKAPISQTAALSVSPDQIDAFVATHPKTVPEQRRVRMIDTLNPARARAVQRAIARGLTWSAAAKRYESDTNTQTVDPKTLEAPLSTAIYRAAQHTVTRQGTTVFKVLTIRPEHPLNLPQQRATAWEVLASDAQERAIGAFEAEWRARWRSRTACAPAVATHPDCATSPTVK